MKVEDFANLNEMKENSMVEHFSMIQENLTNTINVTYYYIDTDNTIKLGKSNMPPKEHTKFEIIARNIRNATTSGATTVEKNIENAVDLYEIYLKYDTRGLSDKQISTYICILRNYLETNSNNGEEVAKCLLTLLENKISGSTCKLPPINEKCKNLTPYYYLDTDNTIKQSSTNISSEDQKKAQAFVASIGMDSDSGVTVKSNIENSKEFYKIYFQNDTRSLTDGQISTYICVLDNFFNANNSSATQVMSCLFALIQNKMSDGDCKLPVSNENCKNIFSKRTDQLKNNIEQQQGNISELNNMIQNKDQELHDKISRSILQQREIDYKKKLISTRNRMLELSQEKNIYKTKVIYTLLAMILMVVIVILSTYVYYKK